MPNVQLNPINLDDDADVLFVFETRSHPEIRKHLFHNPPPTIEAHRVWLRDNVPLKRLMFILRVDGKRVGYCHAYDFAGKDTVEVGFVVHPDYQNRGYGKKAVELLLQYLGAEMPEKKVILYVRKENIRAVGLYRKLGFIESMADQYGYQFDWKK
jgi:RimJ/RimL family protein N-acetyltransferase